MVIDTMYLYLELLLEGSIENFEIGRYAKL